MAIIDAKYILPTAKSMYVLPYLRFSLKSYRVEIPVLPRQMHALKCRIRNEAISVHSAQNVLAAKSTALSFGIGQ